MGFDVDRANKIVTVDHSHNNFATTSVEGNPKTKRYGDMTVIGIFKRNKGANRTLRQTAPDTKIDGDNSPMLYALKNLDGLTTTPSDVCSLFRNARQILRSELEKQSENNVVFTHIITIPSSHKLASIVARMVYRVGKSQNPQMPFPQKGILQKASARQVLDQIQTARIASKAKTNIKRSIKRFIQQNGDDVDFQIKYIKDIKLRQHINLLALTPYETIDNSEINVLLVDDMVTTGSSLIAAKILLLQRYPNATFYSICLFSAS